MPAPSTAINRFDLSMSFSEFDLAASRAGFIGSRVLPVASVNIPSGDFLRINVESLLSKNEDLRRAPRGTYKQGDYEWTKDSFRTDEYGATELVDDAEIALYGDILMAEKYSRERAVDRVLRAFEIGAAGKFFDTAVWTGSDLTTEISTPWTTKSSADPIANIDAAVDKVITNSGQRPNALVLSYKAYRDLIRTARIEDLLKTNGIVDIRNVSPDALAPLIQIPRIVIADGGVIKNTANEGQSAVFGQIWNADYAMVCRIADGPGADLQSMAPYVGRTIVWSGDGVGAPGSGEQLALVTEEYRDEDRRGGKMRVRTNYAFKIMHPESGHLLTGIQS
jgi:hypothetical protein